MDSEMRKYLILLILFSVNVIYLLFPALNPLGSEPPPDCLPPPAAPVPVDAPVDLFLPENTQKGHLIPNFIALCGAMNPLAVK